MDIQLGSRIWFACNSTSQIIYWHDFERNYAIHKQKVLLEVVGYFSEINTWALLLPSSWERYGEDLVTTELCDLHQISNEFLGRQVKWKRLSSLEDKEHFAHLLHDPGGKSCDVCKEHNPWVTQPNHGNFYRCFRCRTDTRNLNLR